MQQDKKTAILIFHDPMTLRGLQLLLEDMNFHVIAASHYQTLLDHINTIDTCPDLLVLPLELTKHEPALKLVNRLRLAYDRHVPAILLDYEDGQDYTQYIGDATLVLPENTKPAQLRTHISELTGDLTGAFNHQTTTEIPEPQARSIQTNGFITSTPRRTIMLSNTIAQKPCSNYWLLIFLLVMSFIFTQYSHAADWKDSQINDIKNKVDTTITNLKNTSSNLGSGARLKSFVDRVQDMQAFLNNDVRGFVEQGRDQVEAALLEQKEGLDKFLGVNNCDYGSPCAQFKDNISSLFANMQTISQLMIQLNPLTPADFNLDMQVFSTLINQTPGKVIYPLYVGMTTGSDMFKADLTEYFQLVAESMEILKRGVVMPSNDYEETVSSKSVATSRNLLPTNCPVIINEILPNIFQKAQRIVFGFALTVKAFAKILIASGETRFSGMQLGVHGYIGGNLANNRKKKYGLIIEGVADSSFMLAGHANNMLRYCTIVNL